jgi:hypothetical protein
MHFGHRRTNELVPHAVDTGSDDYHMRIVHLKPGCVKEDCLNLESRLRFTTKSHRCWYGEQFIVPNSGTKRIQEKTVRSAFENDLRGISSTTTD